MAEKLATGSYNVRRSIALFPQLSFSSVASSDGLSTLADLSRKPFRDDLPLSPPCSSEGLPHKSGAFARSQLSVSKNLFYPVENFAGLIHDFFEQTLKLLARGRVHIHPALVCFGDQLGITHCLGVSGT